MGLENVRIRAWGPAIAVALVVTSALGQVRDAGLKPADAGAIGAKSAETGAKSDAGADAGAKPAGARPVDAGVAAGVKPDAGARAAEPGAQPSFANVTKSTGRPVLFTGDAGLPTTYEDRLCTSCHAKLTTTKFRHGSLNKDGHCYDCHLPALRSSLCSGTMSVGQKKTGSRASNFSVEVSITGWRLSDPEPKLCARCHDALISDGALHGAIKRGGCSICHDAHGSDLKKNLTAPVGVLCGSCHRAEDKRYVHAPVAKGECMACHDAHTGLDTPLLNDLRPKVCGDTCHPKAKLSPGRHAKAQGCLECHVAHASDEPGLMRQTKTPDIKPAPPPASYSTESCQRCHAGLTTRGVRHSVFTNGSCTDCHVPSDRAGACKEPVGKGWALKTPEPALCVRCHDKLQHGTALHKVIELRGCTACHDAHSSEHKNELKKPVEKLCYACHARKDTHSNAHGPTLHRECLKCHDPHSGRAAPLLKDEPGALCLGCHDQKEVLPQTDTQQHEPVVKGRCVECHDAHSADAPRLLSSTGRNLCLNCHEEGRKGRDGLQAAKSQIPATATSVHNPKGDSCQGCHTQSHTGSFKGLLKQAGVRLCLKCHEKVLGAVTLHKVIDQKGCAACHRPHVSENKKLLTRWPIEVLCHECHDKKQTREDLANVHAPVQMGECTACHDAHAGEERPHLRVAKAQLCFECHDMVDIAPKPEVHSAVKEGRCYSCHDAHSSQIKKMLLAPAANLCMNCHDADKPEKSVQIFARIDLSKKVVHKPLLEKDCLECHVAEHSSQVKKLLKKKPVKLCNGCHERKDKKAYTHGAVELGDCPVCHRPHSSDQRNLAPWGREAKLCFECHEDDLSGREVLHKPVAEGRCSRCHDPHGAPYPNNLKEGPGPKLCLKCHEKIDIDVKTKHTPLLRYGCTGCHDAHGTANPAMLPKPINETCIKCHPEFPDGMHAATMMRGGHIVSADFDPRRPDRSFSCASCHNPHGSDNPRMFYDGKNSGEMCDGCHGDRLGRSQMKDVSKKKKPRLPDGGLPQAIRYDAGWLKDDKLAEDEPLERRPPVARLDGGQPVASKPEASAAPVPPAPRPGGVELPGDAQKK